jgi:hypothetical protein
MHSDSMDNATDASALSRASMALVLIAMFGGCLLQPGVARATMLDFDALAAGTLVTTPLSGATFTLSNASAASIFAIAPTGGTTSSLPNTLLNASSFSSATLPGALTIAFLTPMDDVNFTYTYENGDVTFTVFQGTNTTVITKPFDSAPLDVETADFSAFSGVTAVKMSYAYPDDYIAIDNLSFVPIPEPATALGGVLGVLSWGRARRKRRCRVGLV